MSNQQIPTFTKTGKVSKTIKYSKLVDKTLVNECSLSQNKVSCFGKFHDQLDYIISFENFELGSKTYSVVRVLLKSKGKNIFKEPVMLVTNKVVTSLSEAMEVYKSYVLRFKIEVVFRFMKQNLGWETFQIRDFNSISNLLALIFFLVGYFKGLEEELENTLYVPIYVVWHFRKVKLPFIFYLKASKR